MNELAVGEITMGLLGGLAIFLFGMEQLTGALKSVAGAGMSAVLGKLTKNRFMAAITGAFVTAVIQSSSVTTVLVVGFISAGLMTLSQSIGVIIGANIGTTITGQIIAFKVTHYALILVALGFAMLFLSKRQGVRQYGNMIMGLGLVFFGMGIMSEATNPLRSYAPFIEMMQRMDRAWLAILVSAGFTALVQSSSATTGIVIVLASQGFITLEAGIVLSFGANIGTCVTAILASLGKPRAAAQAAAVHLIFNVLGVAIWLPFIGVLASVVTFISPSHAGLEGAALLAAETPRQIANAHTIFNVANTLLFIWFTTPLAWLVKKMLPERPVAVAELARPKYMDESFLETPSIALDSIRRETVRFGREVAMLMDRSGPVTVRGDKDDVDMIAREAENLATLYQSIAEYSRELAMLEITNDESRRLSAIGGVAGNVQHMAETIGINLVAIGRERLEEGFRFSDATIAQFRPLRDKVSEAFALSIEALESEDVELARRVVAMKPEIQELGDRVMEHLGERLVASDPDRAVLYRAESQIVELLQRMYYFTKKIGKRIVAEAEMMEGSSFGEGDVESDAAKTHSALDR